MDSASSVAPLRIANEAFMVAATIERCPKTMMLRELLVNAIEAAAAAEGGPKQVRIGGVAIDGAPKLSVWNTGRGLSADELLLISDLSSSLFKTMALDGNFGMGAKVASLTSNRHGLRYRSCRLGRVSQIVLGERGGVFGRLLQADADGASPAEVIDVTAACLAEGRHDLAQDWTEVVLFGNAPGQDTVRDPYGGNPAVARDWLLRSLGRRFFRIAPGVEVWLDPGATGSAAARFESPLGPSHFDRVERVPVEDGPGDGIVLHYCYRAGDPGRDAAGSSGLGAVLFAGEIYGLSEDRRWQLEAPTYGFTFAARQCTVLVELPESHGVQPEQYRQFLRYGHGDQRQVQFSDFGALVRENIPGWLRDIIAGLLPRPEDFLAEIRSDLQDLLVRFGIPDPPRPAAQRPAADPVAAEGAAPPPPALPSPPEIILLDDEEELVGKGLGGRAARYYPGTRQLFCNTRYSAFLRLEALLAEEFAASADPATLEQLARQAVRWALVRQLARGLVHTLAKPRAGWNDDETRSVQTPEAFSLLVDDDAISLPQARRRLSALLGLETPGEGTGSGMAGPEMEGARNAQDLAEAEGRLQRARAANVARPGPLYRQIAAIHLQRRDPETARAWLDRGIEADPADPWCRYELAGMLISEGKLDDAAGMTEAAMGLADAGLSTFMRRKAEIETLRGDLPGAEAVLREAMAVDPESPWPHFDLAGLRLARQDLDGAARAADASLALAQTPFAALLSRRAQVARLQGDEKAAIRLLEEAVAAEPKAAWARLSLAQMLSASGEKRKALHQVDEALAGGLPQAAGFHRLRSEIELSLGNLAAAVVAAEAARRTDPEDPLCHHAVSTVLVAANDLDGAAAAARRALDLSPHPPAWLLRQMADIAARRNDHAGAREWIDRAIATDPADPYSYMFLSSQLLAAGDLGEAEGMARAGLERLNGRNPASFLRRLGEIAFRRGDRDEARRLLDRSQEADPADPWTRSFLSRLLLEEGEIDQALRMAEAAVSVSAKPHVSLLRACGAIERRRGNLAAARGWFERAAEADPRDPQPWHDLSMLLTAEGDLDGAQHAAEKAVSLVTRPPGPAPETVSAAA